MSRLFAPITIRGIEIKNRLWISPMCQYSADDGFVNDWHMQWLGSLAVGGHGLVMTEATAVSTVGRHSLFDAGLWRDEHVEAWKPVVNFCRSYGATMGVQIAHAGRKAGTRTPWQGRAPLTPEEGGWLPVGPSAIAAEGQPVPRVLTLDEIKEVIQEFVRAARRAVDAGFQVIEIHSAHGYLLHEFLSPLSNTRTDEYGGSFENRCRLVLDVLRAVRTEVGGETPIFVRLSCTDYAEGGWTLDDTVELSAMLRDAGCDLIDCSSGGLVPINFSEVQVGRNYQVAFSKAVRDGANILSGAVGLITEAEQAEAILQEGQADALLVARAAMRNPYFALAVADKLGVDVEWPSQLERAKRQKKR